MATRDRTRVAPRNGALSGFGQARLRTGFDDGSAPPRYDWRADVRTAAGLNVLAGIWLIISPFVLDYTGSDATWNPIVFGAIVALFGFARMAGAYRAAWLSILNMAIGVWLFISAFWLADSPRASWNVGILGVIVFILGSWSATATQDALVTRARQ
jgi:hypothetical protein